MSDGGLSQDEIDSLLMGDDNFDIPGAGGDNGGGIGEDVTAPLQEVLAGAADNMGGALTAMLGQTITIGKPEVRSATIDDNPDIDTMRSKYNFHIAQPVKSYLQETNGRIETAGCKTRKDSVRFIDTLITASPDFFKGKKHEEVKATPHYTIIARSGIIET